MQCYRVVNCRSRGGAPEPIAGSDRFMRRVISRSTSKLVGRPALFVHKLIWRRERAPPTAARLRLRLESGSAGALIPPDTAPIFSVAEQIPGAFGRVEDFDCPRPIMGAGDAGRFHMDIQIHLGVANTIDGG